MLNQAAVTVPVLPAQKRFIRSTAKYPAISGGLGSGKTGAATLRLITLMLADPGINTLIGMPTYDLLKLRAMPGVEADLMRMGLPFIVNKTDYYISVLGYGRMYFRSYDRPERWVAFEVAHTILDELDTLPMDKAELVWRKANERTRQKCHSYNADGKAIPAENTIGNVTTPDQGIVGFTCKKWGGNENTTRDQGFELIFADTRENHYNPEGYYEQIMENYDPLLAEMYTQGKFVSLNENKVYHYFDRKKHHTNRVIEDSDKVLHVGIDFNVGGCCSNVFVIDENKPRAVDEFVSHNTAEFILNLDTRYKGKKVIVYPDSSGGNDSTNASASDISMINTGGYVTDCPNKNPYVRDRVNAMNAQIGHFKMMVNTDKCPQLTFSLESQGYDKNGAPEKFKTHPAIDDWLDNTGYFINRKWPIIIGASSVSQFSM